MNYMFLQKSINLKIFAAFLGVSALLSLPVFAGGDTTWAQKNEYTFSQRKQKEPVNLYKPVSGASGQSVYTHGAVSVPTAPNQSAEPIYFQTMPSSQYGAKFNFSPSGNSGMSVGTSGYPEDNINSDNQQQNYTPPEQFKPVNNNTSDENTEPEPYETPNVPPLYQNFQ